MPRILAIDIETYSSAPLPKCGVYRYVDAPDFEILLFSYAYDDESVQTVDMASGERLPPDVLSALSDPVYLKFAFNAAFERVCLSKYLGHWLDPTQWRCSAVMAATLTLPARLADVAVALKLTQQKMEEGKELIRFFSIPCKATKTNGGRTRNLPQHAPDKWETYKQYNAQDVETERAVRKALEAYPLPESEWALYALDQRINDRGVRVDRLLVKNAMAVDQAFSAQAFLRAKELTGLENPGSVSQLKAWLADQNMPMESLAKKVVQETAKSADGIVKELLDLRLDLSKTSIKKYEAMARCVCRDGRVHGMLQFYGANRTGRWSGRNIQLQNLPQNHLPDLCIAEGQLVLTHCGLIPIEHVTTAHRVWDGEEWVQHDGVVYKGRREVITYDGLTATSDHLVWVEGKPRPIQFGIAAASGARLAITEHRGQAVWLGKDHQFRKTMECKMESLLCTDRMYVLPQCAVDDSWKSDARSFKGMSKLFGAAKANTDVAGSAIDCGQTAVRKSKRQTILQLWRKRYQIPVSVCDTSRNLDSEKRPECVQRERNGQDRQRWQLRSGKHSLCISHDQFWQSQTNCVVRMGSRILALLSKCCNTYALGRKNAGGNHRICPSGSSSKAEGLEGAIRTARLYDIRNAGAHHRFTVSGHLVHNCGYGGGVGALKAMGAKMPEEEMQPLVGAWRAANPRIVALWGAMERAARKVSRDKSSARIGKAALYWQDDKMFMRLPSGRNLCYQSPHFTTNRFGNDAIGYFAPNATGQMVEQETFGGKLVENLTQSVARDLLAYGMTQLEAEGYPIIFHVHDEAVIEMPIGQGSVEEACEIMARAPAWADGLPVRADGDEMAFYQKS